MVARRPHERRESLLLLQLLLLLLLLLCLLCLLCLLACALLTNALTHCWGSEQAWACVSLCMIAGYHMLPQTPGL